MTNDMAIAALKDIKTYVAAGSLDAVDYAIDVLKKLNELGIDDPLNLQDVTEESSQEGGN